MKFLSLEKELFGLDISDASLKLAKIRRRGKNFAISSFSEIDIDSGVIEGGVIKNEEALVKIIKVLCKNIKGKKLKTKYVVASLPEEKSFLQVIQMPVMKKEELTSAVLFEAENYIPLPISEVYLDFSVIPSAKQNPNHLDVLIVATPKKIANTYVSCLKKAGLIPYIFEVESQAIARTIIKHETHNSPTIIVDFGKTSTIFIVVTGESIQFTCSIPVSSGQITDAIVKSLEIDQDKAEKIKIKYDLVESTSGARTNMIGKAMYPVLENLVSQVKKYLNFYQDHTHHEYPDVQEKVTKVILCGGGANLKGLTSFLSEKLNLPVEIGNPLADFSKKDAGQLHKNPLSFATALGLALRQFKDVEHF